MSRLQRILAVLLTAPFLGSAQAADPVEVVYLVPKRHADWEPQLTAALERSLATFSHGHRVEVRDSIKGLTDWTVAVQLGHARPVPPVPGVGARHSSPSPPGRFAIRPPRTPLAQAGHPRRAEAAEARRRSDEHHRRASQTSITDEHHRRASQTSMLDPISSSAEGEGGKSLMGSNHFDSA